MVFNGFGTNFDDFWWLGDKLEISWFLMAFRGALELRAQCRRKVFGIVPGPHSNSQTVGVAIQHANTLWNIQEWRDTKKQDAHYENTKNQSCNMLSLQKRKQEKNRADASQLGAPLRGAGGLITLLAVLLAISLSILSGRMSAILPPLSLWLSGVMGRMWILFTIGG